MRVRSKVHPLPPVRLLQDNSRFAFSSRKKPSRFGRNGIFQVRALAAGKIEGT